MYIDNYIPHQNKEYFERGNRWYHELHDFFIDAKDIPYAILKGEALSIKAYGDMGYRRSGDIDILISRNSIPLIHNILEKHGFKSIASNTDGTCRSLTRREIIMFAMSHQVCPYEKDDINIDINVDLFWGEYRGPRLDIDKLLKESTECVEIHQQKVKTLNDVTSFVALCLHHYREMNAIYFMKYSNPFQIKYYRDVYYLFKSRLTNNIDEIISFSKHYNIDPYVFYVLYLTNLIYHDAHINDLLDNLRSKESVDLIDYYGLSFSEKRKWPVDFFERLDREEIFSLIENQLTEADIQKINNNWSVYN